MTGHRRQFHLVGLLLALIGSMAFGSGGALAQEDLATPIAPVSAAVAVAEDVTIPVDAATCDVAQCPPFTSFLVGLEIIAREEGTGNILDSCTNTADGCELTFSGDALYYLDYGDEGVPDEYKFSTVYETDGMTGPRTWILVFVPDSTATRTIQAQAALCDEPTCPPYSSFVGFFDITVHDSATDAVLDSCTTTQNGSICFLVIPDTSEDFYFSWDEDDVPEGYLFKEVQESDGMTGPRVYTLMMVPESSELTTLHVNAATCTAAECPPYDDFISNIDIFAREDGTNTILAYCTTPPNTQNNSCELKIPVDITGYYLDYSPEGVPAGFVFSHIDISDGEMGPVTHTLVFVPVTARTILVAAATCTAAVCPPYDGFIGGMDIFLRQDGTNTILDYCVTPFGLEVSTCEVTIPEGITEYYLDYAPEAVPEGFVFSRIDETDGMTGPRVWTLVFVPEGTHPTETPETPTHEPTNTPATKTPVATSAAVSGLPTTGTVGAGGSDSTGLLLATAGVLLAGAFALGANRLRRR